MTTKWRKIEPGLYHVKPFFGHQAAVYRASGKKEWQFVITENEGGQSVAYGTERTLAAAKAKVAEYGRTHTVEVLNLMSGKPVQLALSEVGGPCDPSTERYWTM